mmetsp:Transcript_8848/g.17186  ORF Transcript_8848/g.17186 Transcript_8848/m.17186 type:complete len:175 (-) Transcript_8848:83-607(-)
MSTHTATASNQDGSEEPAHRGGLTEAALTQHNLPRRRLSSAYRVESWVAELAVGVEDDASELADIVYFTSSTSWYKSKNGSRCLSSLRRQDSSVSACSTQRNASFCSGESPVKSLQEEVPGEDCDETLPGAQVSGLPSKPVDRNTSSSLRARQGLRREYNLLVGALLDSDETWQ